MRRPTDKKMGSRYSAEGPTKFIFLMILYLAFKDAKFSISHEIKRDIYKFYTSETLTTNQERTIRNIGTSKFGNLFFDVISNNNIKKSGSLLLNENKKSWLSVNSSARFKEFLNSNPSHHLKNCQKQELTFLNLQWDKEKQEVRRIARLVRPTTPEECYTTEEEISIEKDVLESGSVPLTTTTPFGFFKPLNILFKAAVLESNLEVFENVISRQDASKSNALSDLAEIATSRNRT